MKDSWPCIKASPFFPSSSSSDIPPTPHSLLAPRACTPKRSSSTDRIRCFIRGTGMASPLIGVAGVNSLLFASYGISKRIISPYPELSLKETALAGAMAGAANSVLASPGESTFHIIERIGIGLISYSRAIQLVEMFKVRMQGQYGGKDDKRLRVVVSEMWKEYGFRQGIMRGFWVSVFLSLHWHVAIGGVVLTRRVADHSCQGNTCVCWVRGSFIPTLASVSVGELMGTTGKASMLVRSPFEY